MAQILDIGDSTVKKYLNKLKEMGVILFFIVLTIKIMTKIIDGVIIYKKI